MESTSQSIQGKTEIFSTLASKNPSERLPIFEKALIDRHINVRLEAAKFIDLCPAKFLDFLNDPFDKVRCIIIEKSPSISNPDVFVSVCQLNNDPSPLVRISLARVLNSFIKSKTDPLINNCFEVILYLLQDFDDEVRIEASHAVQSFAKKFGSQYLVTGLYEHWKFILNDLQWRVQQVGIELLLDIAYQSKPIFFEENLLKKFVQFLKKPCHKLRVFLIQRLPDLFRYLDKDDQENSMLIQKFFPIISTFGKAPNTISKETYILCISTLVPLVPEKYLSNFVFQPLINLLRESFATQYFNITILSMVHLEKHIKLLHPFRIRYDLLPLLEQLESKEITVKAKADKFILNLRKHDSKQYS